MAYGWWFWSNEFSSILNLKFVFINWLFQNCLKFYDPFVLFFFFFLSQITFCSLIISLLSSILVCFYSSLLIRIFCPNFWHGGKETEGLSFGLLIFTQLIPVIFYEEKIVIIIFMKHIIVHSEWQLDYLFGYEVILLPYLWAALFFFVGVEYGSLCDAFWKVIWIYGKKERV